MNAYTTQCPVCLERIEFGGAQANEPYALAAHRLEGDCTPAKEAGRLVFGGAAELKKYDARMREQLKEFKRSHT